jgi:hypothetical protein
MSVGALSSHAVTRAADSAATVVANMPPIRIPPDSNPVHSTASRVQHTGSAKTDKQIGNGNRPARLTADHPYNRALFVISLSKDAEGKFVQTSEMFVEAARRIAAEPYFTHVDVLVYDTPYYSNFRATESIDKAEAIRRARAEGAAWQKDENVVEGIKILEQRFNQDSAEKRFNLIRVEDITGGEIGSENKSFEKERAKIQTFYDADRKRYQHTVNGNAAKIDDKQMGILRGQGKEPTLSREERLKHFVEFANHEGAFFVLAAQKYDYELYMNDRRSQHIGIISKHMVARGMKPLNPLRLPAPCLVSPQELIASETAPNSPTNSVAGRSDSDSGSDFSPPGSSRNSKDGDAELLGEGGDEGKKEHEDAGNPTYETEVDETSKREEANDMSYAKHAVDGTATTGQPAAEPRRRTPPADPSLLYGMAKLYAEEKKISIPEAIAILTVEVGKVEAKTTHQPSRANSSPARITVNGLHSGLQPGPSLPPSAGAAKQLFSQPNGDGTGSATAKQQAAKAATAGTDSSATAMSPRGVASSPAISTAQAVTVARTLSGVINPPGGASNSGDASTAAAGGAPAVAQPPQHRAS